NWSGWPAKHAILVSRGREDRACPTMPDNPCPAPVVLVPIQPLRLGGAHPLHGYRLRPLVGNDLRAAGLLLGADRGRIFPELRSQCHRLLDRRTLADFLQPALHVRELIDVDAPAG